MKEELKKLSFKSEEEEAQWWDKNQDALAQAFFCSAMFGSRGRPAESLDP